MYGALVSSPVKSNCVVLAGGAGRVPPVDGRLHGNGVAPHLLASSAIVSALMIQPLASSALLSELPLKPSTQATQPKVPAEVNILVESLAASSKM